MKYEMIIFDADETLFDFKKSEKFALEEAIKEAGINYDEAYHLSTYTKINIKIWREFEKGLITQKELKVDRFRRFLTELNNPYDVHMFADTFMTNLAKASFLYDDAEDFIKTLHKDYRLAIITNGLKRVQEIRIKKSSIAHYFESIVISEEVGLSKPDPKIFDYMFDRIDYVDKSKVLMVGDSLTSDIPGGINAGIDTCWFNQHKVVNKTSVKPLYTIHRLSELYDII